MNVKKWLKRILPASFHKIDFLSEQLQHNIDNNSQSINKLVDCITELKEDISYIKIALDDLRGRQDDLSIIISSTKKEVLLAQNKIVTAIFNADNELLGSAAHNHSQLDAIQKSLIDEIYTLKEQTEKNMDDVLFLQKDMVKLLHESLWSAVFNNTIHSSSWLINQSFSPGRWALGYPALYILYRILNDFTPHSILELGLGQSTKMILQYAESHKNITHFVVEHDTDWVNFFLKSSKLPTNSHIVNLEREFVHYKESAEVRVFKDFKNNFESYKFDLIMVDAPLGGDMKEYSRIDILSLIDGNLCEEFVIILDDVNRQSERNTMKEISRKLEFSGIKYSTKIYSGEKETCIWTSPAWTFLCSL